MSFSVVQTPKMRGEGEGGELVAKNKTERTEKGGQKAVKQSQLGLEVI